MSMVVAVPELERWERYASSGMTKYEYDEIEAAVNAWNSAYARWREAVNSASKAIEATFGTRDVFLLPHDNASLNDLHRLLEIQPAPAEYGKTRRGSNEAWPVASWERATRAYEHLARRIFAAKAALVVH